MSLCIAHEPCPECGSRDNLARYDDGHGWCFGCGYFERGDRPKARMPAKAPRTASELPNDLTGYLPSRNREWLFKYGLKPWQVDWFKYSPSLDRHVYVVTGEHGQPVYWEARSVTGAKPKTLSHGEKPVHVFNPSCNTLVLTEDIISAIRVSNHYAAMPLFGAHLNDKNLLTITLRYDRIVVWLDEDKYREAVKIKKRIEVFKKSLVIHTDKDPKEYPEEEMKKILDKVLET